MNILLSNDDGIDYVGLKELAKVLSEFGDVYVIAPNYERSANSHHFTIRANMEIEEKQLEGVTKAYSLDGTPCDCVHCGLGFLLKDKNIDLVVSGINKGWNMLSDTVYSGTIACAREGFMHGVPSIAFSVDNFHPETFEPCKDVVREVVSKYVNDPNKYNYYLSVNIPYLEKFKGYKVCGKLGWVEYDEGYHFEKRNNKTYVVAGAGDYKLGFDRSDMDIDINSLRDGYVVISILDLDCVNHSLEKAAKEFYE